MTVLANNTYGVVTSGGTTGPPSSGSSDTWTVSATGYAFPASLSPGDSFHVIDQAQLAEKVLVTAISGSGPYTWTVTRGDEGTTPVLHAANFVLQQAVTSGELNRVFSVAQMMQRMLTA